MVGREAAAAAGAQHVLVAKFGLADRAPEFEPLRPFDFDRRHRQEQRARKIRLGSDAGLGQRFLGDHFGQPLGQSRRGDGIDADEIDGARHGRFQPVDRKTRHGADAGFARDQLAPIVRLAGAERGHDAHAGDDDDRPAQFIAWC
jgi:hypothetical protein